MEHAQIQSLDRLENGRRGTIVELKGERRFRERMLVMGISVGSQFELIHNGQSSGPSLILLGESRIALDYSMAQNIMVLPEPKQDPVWDSAISRLKSIWSLS